MPTTATRRVLAAAAVVLAAAACGTPTPPPAEGPAPSGAFPVTITHAFGTATIEAAPARIVALGKMDAEAAVVLGVPPVATSFGLDVYP